jgi:hypothetical protein
MRQLEIRLSHFEEVLVARFPWHLAASPAARAIRELFAASTANAILESVRVLFSREANLHSEPFSSESLSGLRLRMPSIDAVRRAIPVLLKAAGARDGGAAAEALRDMGVFALCLPADRQFKALELSVGSIVGQRRLIPLVELAVFAANVSEYDRASAYLGQASSLSPGPSELHNLHTVAGLIDLHVGNLAEADEHLNASVDVCQSSDFACLTCSVRTLNLSLAQRLLEHGERSAVVEFLVRCQDVWKRDARRISASIELIQMGMTPDLDAIRMLERLRAKMARLVVESDLLGEEPFPQPDEGSGPSRAEMLADYRRLMAAATKGKLGTTEN